MQPLGIDFTPALVVIGVGCLIPVVFAWLEARADRKINERVEAMFEEFKRELESHTE